MTARQDENDYSAQMDDIITQLVDFALDDCDSDQRKRLFDIISDLLEISKNIFENSEKMNTKNHQFLTK